MKFSDYIKEAAFKNLICPYCGQNRPATEMPVRMKGKKLLPRICKHCLRGMKDKQRGYPEE